MAPAGTKRPPDWPCADEDANTDETVQHKRAKKCLEGVAKYRSTVALDGPLVNTWVKVVTENNCRKGVDRAAAATPALVTAVTVEDGVGSATVIYPNPLVLLHGFTGPALKRILVPFRRLRAYNGSDKAELKKLEEQLFMGVKAATKSAAAAVPPGVAEATDEVTPDSKADADAELEPRTPPRCRQPPSSPATAPKSAAVVSAKDAAKRLREFTVAVSRTFQKSGTEHISKAELTLALGDAYSAQEVQDLIIKLEELNKVFTMDEIIFRVS